MKSRSTIGRSALLAGAAGLAWSAFGVPHAVELPAALPGERRERPGRAGLLSHYAAGAGRPLLLLHSINAAASAFEMKPIYEHCMATRRVFAPDLPGFGFSERSARRYDAALYVAAIDEMLDTVEAECDDVAFDVVALSLGCEFVARALAQRPRNVRRLALIAPTGFTRAAGDGDREVPALHAALSFPLWSQALYDGLTSRRSIRYFLRRTCGCRDVDDALVDYDWHSAHRPGARHAPLAFLSGRLFSADARRYYAALAMPTWLAQPTRGDFRDAAGAEWARSRTNWTVQTFDSGALPHWERPRPFLAALDAFFDAA
jgi:pimeloyl-ACP methyl ester carboxylesterase